MYKNYIISLICTVCFYSHLTYAQQSPNFSINLLPEEGESIFSIDISDGQKYLLIGSRKPILWDAESGEKIRTFSGHDEFDSTTSFRIGVLSADISPDLSTIVSGDNRANIVISNFNNGQPIFKIKSTNLDPSGGGIVGVAVMPDNKRVLSANGNGTMEMWNIETGELIKKYSKGGIKSIILLNDGRRVIMDLGVTIIVFDLDLGETIKGMQGIYPSVTSDNKILQIIGPSQQSTIIPEIQHWDLSTYEIVKRFPIDQDAAFSSIDISPDGKNFITGNGIQQNGTASITNRVLFDAITPGSIRSYTARANADKNSPESEDQIIKYFPFGRKFLTVNGNAVHIWDISDVVTRVRDAGIHNN